MSRIHIAGEIFDDSKGKLLVLRVKGTYLFALNRFRDVHAKHKEKHPRILLDLEIEERLPGRTLSMNSLQWALVDVTVNEINQGRLDPEEKITSQGQYRQDMLEHAPVNRVMMEEGALAEMQKAFLIRRWYAVEEKPGWITAEICITSSHWNIEQAHRYIQFLFDRLAWMGVDILVATDIEKYWRQWRQKMNDDRFILEDPDMTEEEYRHTHPICEGCGRGLYPRGGHIHHISSRGSGITWEEEKDKSGNLLALCDECHIGWGEDSVHGTGALTWLEGHLHLEYKIKRALRLAG